MNRLCIARTLTALLLILVISPSAGAQTKRNAQGLTGGAAHHVFVDATEVVFPAIRIFLSGKWPNAAEKVTDKGDMPVSRSNHLQQSEKVSSHLKQEKKDDSIKAVSCDLNSDKIDAIKLVEENAIKLALYTAVISGKGIVKARKDCFTIEGDPLPIYATSTDGKIKITRDYSKDRHFWFAGVLKVFGTDSFTTRQVEIGYLDDSKFIRLDGALPPEGKKLVLRLKGKEYF